MSVTDNGVATGTVHPRLRKIGNTQQGFITLSLAIVDQWIHLN